MPVRPDRERPSRRPCVICEAHGVKTMTTHRSSWTVRGGALLPCDSRPVCKACDVEAGRYPVIAAPSVPEGEDPADWIQVPHFSSENADALREYLNRPLPPERKRRTQI